MAQKPFLIDDSFLTWISSLKKEIRQAQLKAAVRVNSELLHLYWHLGKEITSKQKQAQWGDGWLKEMSHELLVEFPDMKGFSYRNLRYIRQWYNFYHKETIWQQLFVLNAIHYLSINCGALFW